MTTLNVVSEVGQTQTQVGEKIRISVPDLETRLKWQTLDDVTFTSEEIFEIVMRWCDVQNSAKAWRVSEKGRQSAKTYRVKKAAEVKLILAKAKEMGIVV